MYAIRASSGVSNVYHHYLIRDEDQFYYMGEHLSFSYDTEQNLFYSTDVLGGGCYVQTNYELRNYRLHAVGEERSDGCSRM